MKSVLLSPPLDKQLLRKFLFENSYVEFFWLRILISALLKILLDELHKTNTSLFIETKEICRIECCVMSHPKSVMSSSEAVVRRCSVKKVFLEIS